MNSDTKKEKLSIIHKIIIPFPKVCNLPKYILSSMPVVIVINIDASHTTLVAIVLGKIKLL